MHASGRIALQARTTGGRYPGGRRKERPGGAPAGGYEHLGCQRLNKSWILSRWGRGLAGRGHALGQQRGLTGRRPKAEGARIWGARLT